MLKVHFQPKPLVIAERFHFHCRDQAVGESIADYVAQLRHLSAHCEFGEYLNDALRDLLVCGMRSESAQKRLLSESDLTFQARLGTFPRYGGGRKECQSVERHRSRRQRSLPFAVREKFSSDHEGPVLPMRPIESRCKQVPFCGCDLPQLWKKGHITPACRTNKSSGRKPGPRKGDPKAQYVATAPEDSPTDDFLLHTVGAKPSRPMTVDLLVNGK